MMERMLWWVCWIEVFAGWLIRPKLLFSSSWIFKGLFKGPIRPSHTFSSWPQKIEITCNSDLRVKWKKKKWKKRLSFQNQIWKYHLKSVNGGKFKVNPWYYFFKEQERYILKFKASYNCRYDLFKLNATSSTLNKRCWNLCSVQLIIKPPTWSRIENSTASISTQIFLL